MKYGITQLDQTLLAAKLVDEYELWIMPTQRNAFRGSGNDQWHQGIMPVSRALWAIGKLVRVRRLRASPWIVLLFAAGDYFRGFFCKFAMLCATIKKECRLVTM